MDSDARLDHVTIFEFAKMLGEGGMEKVNGVVLGLAKEYDLLDISTVMSDTTAQEAAVPYPNEVGLMGLVAEWTAATRAAAATSTKRRWNGSGRQDTGAGAFTEPGTGPELPFKASLAIHLLDRSIAQD